MFRIMLALHLLTAIFAIGPLAHSVTTASRALRTGDAGAAQASARMVRVYSLASILVVIFGFGLMSAKDPDTGKAVAGFSELWIWLSIILWVVAVGLALGVVAPALEKVGAGDSTGAAPANLTGRVAASGGAIGVILAIIVFVMVYKPGS